jgi:YD repeat-containing protein
VEESCKEKPRMPFRKHACLGLLLLSCGFTLALRAAGPGYADAPAHRYLVTLRRNAPSGPDVIRAYGTVESWDGINAVVVTSTERAEMMKIDPRIESVTEQSARPALTKSPRSAPYSWDIAYDGSGNIKSMGVDSYLYDSLGRLTQATSNGTANRQDYTYDAFGNRTAATRISGSAPCVGNTACEESVTVTCGSGVRKVQPRPQSHRRAAASNSGSSRCLLAQSMAFRVTCGSLFIIAPPTTSHCKSA